MIKRAALTLCLLALARSLSAAGWEPSPGHIQIPIWPGTPPHARPAAKPETTGEVEGHWVAGRPWHYVSNVSRPTMTIDSPKGKNSGAAMVVFPGGGYQNLAIDLEGTEICDWLTSRGMTCVLLKYRVPHSGPSWNQQAGYDADTRSSMALEDAQRTISLVRHRAAEWHIDPHKIGVIGFSAGGHMVATTSTHFDRRVYPAVDAADRESCRPDFAVALYPGHLFDRKTRALYPDLRVTKDTPPTFLLHAEDDPVDPVRHSLAYYEALKNAGVPVEMHLYAEGGHAFGLRRTKHPITAWPRLVEGWLKTIGVLPQ